MYLAHNIKKICVHLNGKNKRNDCVASKQTVTELLSLRQKSRLPKLHDFEKGIRKELNYKAIKHFSSLREEVRGDLAVGEVGKRALRWREESFRATS